MCSNRISIIIPVYNSSMHLRECIQSVVDQNYDNLEIIIVDDGSTDCSMDIAREFVDERIRIISQENKGVSTARNVGISESTGEYLCFVDSDDVLEREFVSDLYDCLSSSGCDAVFSNFKFFYPDGRTVEKKSRLAQGSYSVGDLLPKVVDDGTLSGILFGSVWAALYDASIIKSNNLRFREELRINEDGIFNIEFLKLSSCVYVSSNSGYLYRQRSQGLKKSLVFDSRDLDLATKVLESLSSTLPNGAIQMARRRLSVFFWIACRVGDTKEGHFSSVEKLRHFCRSSVFSKTDYDVLDLAKISKAKRLLFLLLKFRLYHLFVLTMRKMVPFFVKRVRH